MLLNSSDIFSYDLRTKVFVMSLKPCIEQMGVFF